MELNIEGLTQEQIEAVTKLVQSETDKVRTKYSSELKTVNDELAQYEPEEKSDEEKPIEKRIPNHEAKQKKVEHFPLLLPPGKAEERREILI